MTLLDYLLLALKENRFLSREWIFAAFSIRPETKKRDDPDLVIGDIIIEDGTAYALTDNGWVTLPYVHGEPLLHYREEISIPEGWHPWVPKLDKTYFSTVVTNFLLLYYPFGDRLPFQNMRFTGKWLDKEVGKLYSSNSITADEYFVFTKCLAHLTVVCNIVVPSASKKGILPPPGAKELKEKLLNMDPEKLKDPAVIAKIEKELVDMLKEWSKGDYSEEFRMKEKAYAVSGKRTHLIYGGEQNMEDPSKYDLITPSLAEGWEPKDMVPTVNASRMGSINRGFQTALGGEAADMAGRLLGPITISDSFCGTDIAFDFTITEYNYDLFEGRYTPSKDGPVLLDHSGMKNKIGERVLIYSPLSCKEKPGFCPICMGDQVTKSGTAPGQQAVAVGSTILLTFLAMMHATTITLVPYDPSKTLR